MSTPKKPAAKAPDEQTTTAEQPEAQEAAKTPKPEAKAVFEAMKVRADKAEKKKSERRRPLTEEQIAKVHLQRLQLAQQRGNASDIDRAVALNAADLGIDPKDYRAQVGG